MTPKKDKLITPIMFTFKCPKKPQLEGMINLNCCDGICSTAFMDKCDIRQTGLHFNMFLSKFEIIKTEVY